MGCGKDSEDGSGTRFIHVGPKAEDYLKHSEESLVWGLGDMEEVGQGGQGGKEDIRAERGAGY